MIVIPVIPATLDLIEKLNNGVRPEIEDQETFYVYRGEDEHALIINREELSNSENMPQFMAVIEVLHLY